MGVCHPELAKDGPSSSLLQSLVPARMGGLPIHPSSLFYSSCSSLVSSSLVYHLALDGASCIIAQSSHSIFIRWPPSKSGLTELAKLGWGHLIFKLRSAIFHDLCLFCRKPLFMLNGHFQSCFIIWASLILVCRHVSQGPLFMSFTSYGLIIYILPNVIQLGPHILEVVVLSKHISSTPLAVGGMGAAECPHHGIGTRLRLVEVGLLTSKEPISLSSLVQGSRM